MKLLKVNIKGKWLSMGRVADVKETGERIKKVFTTGYVGSTMIPADFDMTPTNFKLEQL